jgi:hypothetical protein
MRSIFIFFYWSDFINIPIYISVLVLVIFTILKVIEIKKYGGNKKIVLLPIWLTGVIGFLFCVVAQIYWIHEGFQRISMAGDISASLIASSINATIYMSFIGFYFLIFSLILWGFLKYVLLNKESRI